MRVIEDLEARRLSKVALGFSQDKTVSPIERAGEAMRSVVWALTAAGEKPVFTTSILHRFAEIVPIEWQPTIESEESKPVNSAKSVLDDLYTLGDIEALGSGYWLPAPLKVVRSNTIEKVLLVGGKPTALLNEELRSGMTWIGTIRLIQASPALVEGIPAQNLNSWAGIPEVSIDEWAKTTIEQLRMSSFDEASDSFAVYAPSLSKGSELQYKRWKSVSTKLPDSQYLAKQVIGPMSHFAFVKIVAGQVQESAAIPERVDVRRLMYGMDKACGNQVRFKSVRDGASSTVFVTSEVPQGERRLFHALGRLSIPSNSHYPKVWSFSNDVMPEITNALCKLGVSTIT
jgi:hypothetical protein